MSKQIVVIQGHPDQDDARFCRALARAYVKGAQESKYSVEVLDVARTDFPLLSTKRDFENEFPPAAIRAAQIAIARADHIVIIFPLWLGDMPARLKAFFEQVLRPGFAFGAGNGRFPQRMLQGKSAHVFVTMGMPAWIYRFYFWAHGLKNLRRNILGFCGVKPIQETVIGNIESCGVTAREDWLALTHHYGRKGA